MAQLEGTTMTSRGFKLCGAAGANALCVSIRSVETKCHGSLRLENDSEPSRGVLQMFFTLDSEVSRARWMKVKVGPTPFKLRQLAR